MKKSRIVLLAFATVSLVAGSMGCSAKVDGGNIPPLPGINPGTNPIDKNPISTKPVASQKPAGDPNFVQCSDAQVEVLIDITASDFEALNMVQEPISVRNISVDSQYATVESDQPLETFKDVNEDISANPGNRGFWLGTAKGLGIYVATKDFKVGTAEYIPAQDQAVQALTCTFSTTKPAPLTSPASAPAPITPTPAPAPTASAYYLDCTGQVYEVYMNFSQVDVANWNNVSAATLGSRLVGATTANFTFYPNSGASSYSEGGVNYDSFNGYDQAGGQFNFSLSTSNLTSGTATVSATTAAGQATSDSLNCRWLTSNLYAGQYGW